MGISFFDILPRSASDFSDGREADYYISNQDDFIDKT